MDAIPLGARRGDFSRERKKMTFALWRNDLFSLRFVQEKPALTYLWEHRIVILCKAHKEHIIYICVCTHFLSIICSAKSVNNTKFHHQCAGKQGARKVYTLLHVILYSFSKYIEEGASSWRPAPELEASFTGCSPLVQTCSPDFGSANLQLIVLFFLICENFTV